MRLVAAIYGSPAAASDPAACRYSTAKADLPLRHVRRRATLDRRAADARAIATVSPKTALGVGLKVDVEALPPPLIAALRQGQVNLNDPAVTIELLRLNAVVGVDRKGRRRGPTHQRRHHLRALPLDRRQLVHDRHRQAARRMAKSRSERRRDSRTVTGAADALKSRVQQRGDPENTIRRHHAFDGTNIIPLNSPTLPVLIPPAYGLQGVGFRDLHRRRADLLLEQLRRRVADGRAGQLQRSSHRPHHHAKAGSRHAEAAGTARVSAQSARAGLRRAAASMPPQRVAASVCSTAKPTCATCHKPPTYTDVLSGPDPSVPFLHDPAEVGTEPFYAARSATGKIPHLAATRHLAASPVLPRWQRGRLARRRQSLRRAVSS